MSNPLIKYEPYRNSLNTAFSSIKNKDLLNGKKILVTGSTGMIGSCIVDMLAQAVNHGYKIKIYAAARSREKYNNLFSQYNETVEFVEYNSVKPFECDVSFDYIIHCAANATPIEFAKHPVETLTDCVNGLKTVLDYSKRNSTGRFLYLSSGEYYGDPDSATTDFTEEYCGYIDCSSPRACYPIGKRAGEVLCQSYIAEYNLDIVIARPCHIFGPTMTPNDNRAVSQFLKNAANGNDIVMKSNGMMERSQCYVVDAAAAIIFLLLNSSCGQAYNIADKKYQMTIRDFAEQAAAAAGTKIIMDIPQTDENTGFSKRNRAVLSASKLCDTGFVFGSPERDAIAESVNALRYISNI